LGSRAEGNWIRPRQMGGSVCGELGAYTASAYSVGDVLLVEVDALPSREASRFSTTYKAGVPGAQASTDLGTVGGSTPNSMTIQQLSDRLAALKLLVDQLPRRSGRARNR
jgi:hypothetical protein